MNTPSDFNETYILITTPNFSPMYHTYYECFKIHQNVGDPATYDAIEHNFCQLPYSGLFLYGGNFRISGYKN